MKGQEQGDMMRREMAGLKIQRYYQGNTANEMQPRHSGISVRAWRPPLAAADHSWSQLTYTVHSVALRRPEGHGCVN